MTWTSTAPETLTGLRRRRGTVVNDIHSMLNATRVAGIVRPRAAGELADAIVKAGRQERAISIAGGRHAMGGQQFLNDGLVVDMTGLDRVIEVDGERGLVTVESGITWPALIAHLHWAFPNGADAWGIVQKQTGADRLTIGGALAANIHGRGLRLRPFVGDIEAFELIDASGRLRTCSRTLDRDLFGLAIGGYGLFGPVTRVTLRLARRRKVERRVGIGRVDDLARLFELRIREGFEYGDFQFATDPGSREFLDVGVFSCYRPVAADAPMPDQQLALSDAEWRSLMRLAHVDKSRAFADYARYYMATDGQIYWSDTHQLAEYPDGYHEQLDRQLGAAAAGSEMITELYVPRPALPAFMAAVRSDARQHAVDIIYGTIRLIEPDDETRLAWARDRWACIVFNLHVDHTAAGIAKASADFRRLIDRAIELDGSYYLTYHRWATADQARACHPQLPAFLDAKERFDPAGTFASDWYRHHVQLLETPSAART